MLLIKDGCFYQNDIWQKATDANSTLIAEGKKKTMTYRVLSAHNHSDNMDQLKVKFDSITSHDITYVGIVQTAKASGLEKFPVPYVLTNCHNSLCAVGGTINADDHAFGMSAVKKYGGSFVPAHVAVIHQYMREIMAGGERMILGSDSHTRYGAYGTLAIGEGGGELVKQLIGKTYDLPYPEVVGIYLKGTPKRGVGPQDVALKLIKETFESGFVKNRVLEFIGLGIRQLDMDFRNGIDVMTTETTCLSSIWQTDEVVKEWLTLHGREDAYLKVQPEEGAYYDRFIEIDLSEIECMIALPFHPSNAYTIREFNENMDAILAETEAKAKKILGEDSTWTLRDKMVDGKLVAEQASIAGCAGGTYGNISAAAAIMGDQPIGSKDFYFTVYPSSMPIYQHLLMSGEAAGMMANGTVFKTAFCGPCFGGGETPANNTLSLRHTTRNFPFREGAKPGEGQIASVALMDARSIAASAINGGAITAATDVELPEVLGLEYKYNPRIYENIVFEADQPDPAQELSFGPNIKEWPEFAEMPDQLLLKFAAVLTDPVTTTDELIPSGDTSSYRSNPIRLAEFTLIRKDPEYVGRSKQMLEAERARIAGESALDLEPTLEEVYNALETKFNLDPKELMLGSTIYSHKPGDGSAREQAASCQKVVGGFANVAREYATKRYRSNLINWGMLPLLSDDFEVEINDYLYLPGIHQVLDSDATELTGYLYRKGAWEEKQLSFGELTVDERKILRAGCLINRNRQEARKG